MAGFRRQAAGWGGNMPPHRFADIAKAKNVDLFKLIVEVSKIDRKAPSVELIEKVADTL